jgi:hypothetical protein
MGFTPPDGKPALKLSEMKALHVLHCLLKGG